MEAVVTVKLEEYNSLLKFKEEILKNRIPVNVTTRFVRTVVFVEKEEAKSYCIDKIKSLENEILDLNAKIANLNFQVESNLQEKKKNKRWYKFFKNN
jgi:hypothetical protein